MTEAIKYLEKVVKIARNNFQSLDVIRASTMLGDIYNEKVSCVSLFVEKLAELEISSRFMLADSLVSVENGCDCRMWHRYGQGQN